ncbi:hypothetical protein OESDEN_10457, partial [Oesophagostomum dentatum]
PDTASSSTDPVVDHTKSTSVNAEFRCSQCKEESDHCGSSEVETKPEDTEEPSFFDLVNSFSADIDAFAESVDDLENISESVRSLVRNFVNGDGRPAGAWKDIC